MKTRAIGILLLVVLCGCSSPRSSAPTELEGGYRRECHPAFTPKEREIIVRARHCIEECSRRRRIDAYYHIERTSGGYRVHMIEVISYFEKRPTFTLNRDWSVELWEDGDVYSVSKTVL